MTQLLKFRDAISNYFDDLERGIGKRGSTFTDVDAITHDRDTGRFLFREFKHEGEPLHIAQRWVLAELATLPRCTVWFVRRLDHGLIAWAAFGSGCPAVVITEAEYRRLLGCWWREEPIIAVPAVVAAPGAVPVVADVAPLTETDIRW